MRDGIDFGSAGLLATSLLEPGQNWPASHGMASWACGRAAFVRSAPGRFLIETRA